MGRKVRYARFQSRGLYDVVGCKIRGINVMKESHTLLLTLKFAFQLQLHGEENY